MTQSILPRGTAINFTPPAASSRLLRAFMRYLLPFWFGVCAAYYFVSSFFAAGSYGWLQPSFDQFRAYLLLLQMPFPQSVLQPDNGHHSIFPFLVIIAENQWFAANQILQLVVGLICAVITSLVPALCVWRDPDLSRTERAAGVLLSVLGVFWLANALSILHGNEGLSVYMVSASVVLAAWCTFEAQRRASIVWLAAATCCCLVATFSFGSGIASFPAVIGLAVLLRVPWRRLTIPLAGLALSLVLYLYVLPGDDSIRGMLNIHPLDSMMFAAQWLSSPWINGWLGLADPPAAFVAVDKNQWYGALATNSANAFVAVTHVSWRAWSVIIGTTGLVGFAVYMVLTFFSRREITRVEAVAIALAAFVAMTAAVIGIGRLDYLLANADQSFADRYLIWSSLFWASVGLLVLLRCKRRVVRIPGTVFLALLPVMLYATHSNGLGWGAEVYRGLQANAAALRSGVFDEARFPSDASTGRDNEWHSIDLMQAQHLAMFARPGWERLGKPGPAALDPNGSIIVQAHWEDAFVDPRNGKRAAHFSGFFLNGIKAVPPKWQIMALDEDGKVAGLAEYSYAGYVRRRWLNLDMRRKRGFDGYVRDYDPTKKYTLIAWNTKYDRATPIAELPPGAPARPIGQAQ